MKETNINANPPSTPAAGSALASVLEERKRQNAKWGEQNHDPITWSAILTEECGEFAEAALHCKFGGPAAGGLRDEAVHCAAVALQIVEYLDRVQNVAAQARRARNARSGTEATSRRCLKQSGWPGS